MLGLLQPAPNTTALLQQARLLSDDVVASINNTKLLRQACTCPPGKRSPKLLGALSRLISEFDFFQSLPQTTVNAICQVMRYEVSEEYVCIAAVAAAATTLALC